MNRLYYKSAEKIIVLFAIYFTTASFGLTFDAVSKFATLVWIPTGISIAALVLFGYRLWPGIFMGAFLVNLFHGASPFIALGIGIGNTLEAVIGMYLLKYAGVNRSFRRLKDVLFLTLLVAPFSASISATIGVSSLYLGHDVLSSAYYSTWKAWWVGDLISIFILTPFLLVWSTWPRIVLRQVRVFEALVLTVFLGITSIIVFAGGVHMFHNASPVTYFMFPPVIWASLRFGQRGAVTAVLALSAFAIIETIYGSGPFANGRLSERLLLLQSFMAVIAMTSMILAAVDSERNEIEQRKDEFINLASHELKTPLTSLKVYTQMLYKALLKKKDTQSSDYLKKMNIQIDKLTLLITDLLDVSKIQTGNLEFHKDFFSLLSLINETVEILQTTTTTHSILVKNTNKDTPYTVYADKERIGQALINLCTNAIKYSPNAHKIIVSITSDKKNAIVSVKDYGIGIILKNQKDIFKRYFRVQDSRNEKFSGLGLGLYISHEIIARNNGRMWVQSKNRKGSTFYFSLPLNEKKNILSR